MNNHAFWRAVHSLTHPMTIGAVVLLLLNDHLLRLYWPSWWTGKLGDAAWLLFAPFILALVAAWVVPRRLRHHEMLVGLGSIIFIGVWFALAKTFFPVYTATIGVLDWIVGWHGTLRMDASDLITLPVLGVSWIIWQHVPTTSLNLSPLVWVVAALGVMSTLATSCLPPDTGIRELCLDNGRVVTLTVRGVYASSDGGLTWQAMGEDHQNIECLKETRLDVYSRDSRAWLTTHRSQNFRFAPGDGIYSYTNQVEYLEIDLTALGRKTREVYYEGAFPKVTCEGVVYLPGPLDAISELQSGHLIVAMGLDGILVRDTQGMWQWISVGDYEYAQIDFADSFYLIAPQIITAIVLLFLLPLIFYKLTQEATWLFTVALSLGLFACFINIIFGSLPLVFVIFGLGPIGLVVSAIYFMLLNGYVFLNYWQDYASLWPVVMVIVCSFWVVILTLLPYLLWVQGTIPVQGTANAFALLLGGAGFLASLQYLNKRFARKRKKKKREVLPLDEIYFDDATMN